MHRSAQAWMGCDRGRNLFSGTAVVDRYRQVDVDRERKELVEPVGLHLPRRSIALDEVETDLANGHSALVRCKRAQGGDVGCGLLGRVMAYACEHLWKFMGEFERVTAVVQVDAHGDHSRNAGRDRCFHHLARIAQLLEMQVAIYEDAAGSSSTISSSRLKSASGCASVR